MTKSIPDAATFIDCRVGEIVEVKNIEGSQKLYCLEVEVGEESPRHIVCTARKFYTHEELQGKYVCVFLNAEPTEILGEISEGIILGCGPDDKHIELLEPPLDNQAGDRVYFGDYTTSEDFEVDHGNRHWKKMLYDLRIDNNGDAIYKGENIYTDYGNVTAPNFTNCPFQ
ncbi:TRNA binding domain containing protein [Histomonas meleagridis]|uniref:TRNA binding domain containing protein n=1 Tax=Histomonas meleagridis TaxID=135588 RepID=UPI00355A2A2F|nr:TRNA binding domain containing protein [Histomonas meleagridis]KAH0804831.1 TRNA binding domain containing protein [Histomonas meleagridis]